MVFMCLQYRSLKNTLGKGEIAHSVFYLFQELNAIFIKFEVVLCQLFQLEESKICHLGKG